MELKGKINPYIDYILGNAGKINERISTLIMASIKNRLEETIEKKDGSFPNIGEIIYVAYMMFEITDIHVKEYYTDEGKSEIRLEYIGMDEKIKAQLDAEEEERKRLKGTVKNGIYSHVKNIENLKVRLSFFTNEKVFKDKEPTWMDTYANLIRDNLQFYYDKFKTFPSVGEAIFLSNSSFFIIKHRYFSAFEKKAPVEPIGFFLKIVQKGKDVEDFLDPLLEIEYITDINFN